MTTLEQKIGSALVDDSITSTALVELITEVEIAIVAADQAAATERERAHDPAQSPDPASAYQAMQTAAFAAERLCTLLPRLRQRLQEVQAQEYLAQWRADYEALKIKRDALAAELREVYPVFEAKITDLFTRITANDAELSRLHQARQAGIALHLLSAELVARDLERFTAREPSIAQELKLPTFAPGQRLAWPPPQVPLAVQVAASMIQRPHPGANWASEREERTAALRAEQERVAAYYEEMARQREERENAEAQERARRVATHSRA